MDSKKIDPSQEVGNISMENQSLLVLFINSDDVSDNTISNKNNSSHKVVNDVSIRLTHSKFIE